MHNLDIFVAGSDGKVYTAAWDANMATRNGGAGGPSWMPMFLPAAHVTAISRHPNKLDVFIVVAVIRARSRPHGRVA